MAHHGRHNGKSDDKKNLDSKKSHGNSRRPKNNRPSYLSYLDDHDPGKTTHSQFLDEIPNTKRHRYHPKELSYLLQQNANRRKVSQLTATAQHRLKAPVRMCHSESDAEKLLGEWLPVLDELFFFGTVEPHLKNGIQLLNDPEGPNEGLYNERGSWIKINIGAPGHCIGDRHCERLLLGTLLHEMLHAFLRTFSCTQNCCKSYAADVLGHQAIWCHAMVKLETSFERFVGWDVDCNIPTSVMGDMEKSDWQPKEDQLKRWGLRGKSVFNKDLGEEVGFVRSEWPSRHRSRRPAAYSEQGNSGDEEESDDSNDSDSDDSDSDDSGSDSSESEGSGSDDADSDDSGSEEEVRDRRGHHHSHGHHSSHGNHDRHEKNSSYQDPPRRRGEGESHRKREHRSKPRSSNSSHPQFLDKLPNPKRHRFHPEELGKILRQNARDQSFSHLSARTQELLRSRIPHCESKREIRYLMKDWFWALDEIFYFSQLRNVLKGGIRLLDDSDLDIEGQYNPHSRHIDINIGGHDYEDGQIEEHYIDTLLHEMLHAFMMEFICQKMCCWTKLAKDPEWAHRGTGHGKNWCRTMTEIEDKLAELVDWEVDCGIEVAEELERKDGGRGKPQIGCKPM